MQYQLQSAPCPAARDDDRRTFCFLNSFMFPCPKRFGLIFYFHKVARFFLQIVAFAGSARFCHFPSARFHPRDSAFSSRRIFAHPTASAIFPPCVFIRSNSAFSLRVFAYPPILPFLPAVRYFLWHKNNGGDPVDRNEVAVIIIFHCVFFNFSLVLSLFIYNSSSIPNFFRDCRLSYLRDKSYKERRTCYSAHSPRHSKTRIRSSCCRYAPSLHRSHIRNYIHIQNHNFFRTFQFPPLSFVRSFRLLLKPRTLSYAVIPEAVLSFLQITVFSYLYFVVFLHFAKCAFV